MALVCGDSLAHSPGVGRLRSTSRGLGTCSCSCSWRPVGCGRLALALARTPGARRQYAGSARIIPDDSEQTAQQMREWHADTDLRISAHVWSHPLLQVAAEDVASAVLPDRMPAWERKARNFAYLFLLHDTTKDALKAIVASRIFMPKEWYFQFGLTPPDLNQQKTPSLHWKTRPKAHYYGACVERAHLLGLHVWLIHRRLGQLTSYLNRWISKSLYSWLWLELRAVLTEHDCPTMSVSIELEGMQNLVFKFYELLDTVFILGATTADGARDMPGRLQYVFWKTLYQETLDRDDLRIANFVTYTMRQHQLLTHVDDNCMFDARFKWSDPADSDAFAKGMREAAATVLTGKAVLPTKPLGWEESGPPTLVERFVLLKWQGKL